jgi:hypothetical protein
MTDKYISTYICKVMRAIFDGECHFDQKGVFNCVVSEFEQPKIR